MNFFLKRFIVFLFLLLSILFLVINVIAYFYGPHIVAKFSDNTVIIKKFQSPVLPFFIGVKGIRVANKNFFLDADSCKISLSSLYSIFKGEHFFDITIKNTKAHILSSNDNSTTNLNYLSYLKLFNSINIYNSYIKYSGDIDIIVPIKVASVSYYNKKFNLLLDNVLIQKAHLMEKLDIILRGGINRGNFYISEGGIEGKYIKISIKNMKNYKNGKFMKGYFNAEFLKLFNILVNGDITLDGYYNNKTIALDYKINLSSNLNNIISNGTILSKKNRIILKTSNLSLNDKKVKISSEFNYKKGVAKGKLTLLDYSILNKNPINFIVNIKKRNFRIIGAISLKEIYKFKGIGDFNNNKISLKKFNIHSNSTNINFKEIVFFKGLKGKIAGIINNNEDVKKLLKISTHQININGVFDIERQQKKGSIIINFNEKPLYNIELIKLDISGEDRLKFIMNTIMQVGYFKAYGEIADFNDWKIDYLVNKAVFKTLGEKKLERPLQLDGYGIIQDANGIKSSGLIRIKGITNDEFNLSHYYASNKLKLIVRNILTLQVTKYDKTDGNNYKLLVHGKIKEIPFSIQGNAGIDKGNINYIFHDIAIKNISFSATGNLDINNFILETNIQNKSLANPIQLILKSDLTFKDDLFYVKGQLYSKEKYKLNCRLKKSNDKIYLDTFDVNSNSTFLTAYGNIEGNNFDINISGSVNNNQDIISRINVAHSINLKSNVEMNDNKIEYQTELNFRENLYGFNSLKTEGYFNIKSSKFNANTTILSRYGNVNIKLDKTMRMPVYLNITTEKLKTGIINEIGKIKLSEDGVISASIKGEYSDKLKLKGNVNFKQFYFEKGGIDFDFNGETLLVSKLILENDIFQNPISYSFMNKYLKVYLDRDVLRNKFVNARNIYMDINGPVHALNIDSYFTIDKTPIGTVKFNTIGNFNNLHVNIVSDNLTVDGAYFKKGNQKGLINLFFSYSHVLKGEIPLIVEKKNNNNIVAISNKSTITFIKKHTISLEQLEFSLGKDGITQLHCLLSNDFFEDIILKDIKIGLKGIYGKVNFNNGSIKYEDIFNLHTKGEMQLTYNYSDVPELNGAISGKGFLHYKDVNIKLPIKQFTLEAHNHQIKLYALLYELESWLEVDYSTDNYTNYLDSALNIRGEHIYINKLGFSGIFNVNVQYNKNKRELAGDVFIAKSHYTFENSVVVSSNANSKRSELPVSLNIKVKTVEPVIVETDYANANVNIDLNVLYKKELKLRGKITTTDTEVIIGREKFVIYENYIIFRGKTAPHLYLEARGTGDYSYVVLKIYGDLPNYKIDIMNLDPNSTSFYETETGYNPQNLFTDVFAGLLFNDILKVTENIIGINKIGFEQRAEGGENVNYLKIGRQFSDRFEVKYIIGSQSQQEESEVMMVGEYILLDWFKFSLYSQNRGGSGVGFTFFNDF